MKSLVLLLICALLSLAAAAQRYADVGLSTGVVNYIGDLANEKYIPYSSANTGIQLTVRNFLNNQSRSRMMYKPLSLEIRLSWQRLQYDETESLHGKNGMELRNYLRGLGFRNDLFGFAANITYTFYKNHNLSLYKQKWCYFVFAGIGSYWGQPKADLFRGAIDISNRYYFWDDGTVRDAPESSGKGHVIKRDGKYETNLRDWSTEGLGYNKELHREQPYEVCNMGIPIGFGIRYGLSKYLTLSAEFEYVYIMNDYVDDASERYATYDELSASFPNDPVKLELAKYISDPTGHGTNGEIGPYTSPRGNPHLKDAFTFVSIELAYKFQWKKESVYGR
jgi:hypothetical protein